MRCTFDIAGRECLYVCCSIQQMQEHSWEEHKWKSKNKGGRRKKRGTNQEVPWRTRVHCQRFFIQGHKSGYFEVGKAEASPASSSQPGIVSRTDQYKAAKRELKEALRKAKVEERRVIKEAEEAREPNPWLCRVGWAAYLARLDRTELQEWIELPNNKEPDLEILYKAFD
jgi:hypothetical protein